MNTETEVKQIESPFTLVKVKKNNKEKYAIAIGNQLLTDWQDSEEDARLLMMPDNWEFMAVYIATIAENVFNNERISNQIKNK